MYVRKLGVFVCILLLGFATVLSAIAYETERPVNRTNDTPANAIIASVGNYSVSLSDTGEEHGIYLNFSSNPVNLYRFAIHEDTASNVAIDLYDADLQLIRSTAFINPPREIYATNESKYLVFIYAKTSAGNATVEIEDVSHRGAYSFSTAIPIGSGDNNATIPGPNAPIYLQFNATLHQYYRFNFSSDTGGLYSFNFYSDELELVQFYDNQFSRTELVYPQLTHVSYLVIRSSRQDIQFNLSITPVSDIQSGFVHEAESLSPGENKTGRLSYQGQYHYINTTLPELNDYHLNFTVPTGTSWSVTLLNSDGEPLDTVNTTEVPLSTGALLFEAVGEVIIQIFSSGGSGNFSTVLSVAEDIRGTTEQLALSIPIDESVLTTQNNYMNRFIYFEYPVSITVGAFLEINLDQIVTFSVRIYNDTATFGSFTTTQDVSMHLSAGQTPFLVQLIIPTGVEINVSVVPFSRPSLTFSYADSISAEDLYQWDIDFESQGQDVDDNDFYFSDKVRAELRFTEDNPEFDIYRVSPPIELSLVDEEGEISTHVTTSFFGQISVFTFFLPTHLSTETQSLNLDDWAESINEGDFFIPFLLPDYQYDIIQAEEFDQQLHITLLKEGEYNYTMSYDLSTGQLLHFFASVNIFGQSYDLTFTSIGDGPVSTSSSLEDETNPIPTSESPALSLDINSDFLYLFVLIPICRIIVHVRHQRNIE